MQAFLPKATPAWPGCKGHQVCAGGMRLGHGHRLAHTTTDRRPTVFLLFLAGDEGRPQILGVPPQTCTGNSQKSKPLGPKAIAPPRAIPPPPSSTRRNKALRLHMVGKAEGNVHCTVQTSALKRGRTESLKKYLITSLNTND